MTQERCFDDAACFERGTALEVTENGVRCESLSRPGLVTGLLTPLPSDEISAGDQVYFCMFADGRGFVTSLKQAAPQPQPEEDTGWVDLSSYIVSANCEVRDSLCRARKIGKVCMLQVSVTTRKNIASGSSLQLLNAIPEEFVNGAYVRMATLGSDGNLAVMSLQGVGTVYLYNRKGSQIDSGKWYNGTMTYIAD